MLKQIYKIVGAILVMAITVAFFDVAFGIVADKIFVDNAKISKFDYSISTNDNPNLVFFGSSRAESHYDTPFINDSLKISTFNFGESGRGITYHRAALSAYLQNHHPKMLILELMPNALSGELNNRVKPLYPYIDRIPAIKVVAEDVDPWNRYLLKSHLLRYNSDIFGLIKKYRHKFDTSTRGFFALTGGKNDIKNTEDKIIDSPTDYAVDPVAKQSLIDIVAMCREQNIELVVAYSPESYIRIYPIPATAVLDSLNVRLIDLRDFRSPNDPHEYFYDSYHLNSIGAREYTKHFMKILKQDSCRVFMSQQ